MDKEDEREEHYIDHRELSFESPTLPKFTAKGKRVVRINISKTNVERSDGRSTDGSVSDGVAYTENNVGNYDVSTDGDQLVTTEEIVHEDDLMLKMSAHLSESSGEEECEISDSELVSLNITSDEDDHETGDQSKVTQSKIGMEKFVDRVEEYMIEAESQGITSRHFEESTIAKVKSSLTTKMEEDKISVSKFTDISIRTKASENSEKNFATETSEVSLKSHDNLEGSTNENPQLKIKMITPSSLPDDFDIFDIDPGSKESSPEPRFNDISVSSIFLDDVRTYRNTSNNRETEDGTLDTDASSIEDRHLQKYGAMSDINAARYKTTGSTSLEDSQNLQISQDGFVTFTGFDTELPKIEDRLLRQYGISSEVDGRKSQTSDSASLGDNAQIHDHKNTDKESFEDVNLFITEDLQLKKTEELSEIHVTSSHMTSMTSLDRSEVVNKGADEVGQDITDQYIVPPVNLIEVERKFTFTDTSESRLQEFGATLVKELSFLDIYYDDAMYKLTLTNCWLRQRNNEWQLKAPISETSRDQSLMMSSQFREFTNEKDIIKELCKLYRCDNIYNSVDECCIQWNLEQFAKFGTVRKSYELDGCNIDLDLADFGFKVGEIELMLVDEKRLSEALHRIDELAAKLEFQPFRFNHVIV